MNQEEYDSLSESERFFVDLLGEMVTNVQAGVETRRQKMDDELEELWERDTPQD